MAAKKSKLPAGVKNSAKNKAAVAKTDAKIKKSPGLLKGARGTAVAKPGKKETTKQTANRKGAENRARSKSASADRAAAKAGKGGKAVGVNKSNKIGKRQAKARRLASTGH